MGLLLDSLFLTVASGHLTVDLLNSQRAIYLTFLRNSLGLSATLLATLNTIYIWAASVTQPIFGWLADRIGPRWVATIGILWLGTFFGLAMLLSGWAALTCLMLASLGSAAFHPAGAMEATLRGQAGPVRRETSAASWFFLFGQLGLTAGPMVGGPLLDRFGPSGLLLLAALALPVSLNSGRQLERSAAASPASGSKTNARRRAGWLAVTGLVGLTVLQGWAQQNMITFVPMYISDLGQSAATYGLIAGLFMGGYSVGGVLGGGLADRVGRRAVAVLSLALGSLPLFAIAGAGWTPWLYLLVPLAGLLIGAVHSIVVVTSQALLPGGMGLNSGLALGFMFSAGALGTLLCGPLVDAHGYPPLFLLTGGLAALAALLSLTLPGREDAIST